VFSGEGSTVANVLPGGPAAQAGLSYGMEILAVNGWRTTSGPEVQRRLGDRGPGDRVELVVADRGRVQSCALNLVENPLRTVQIHAAPGATAAQREAFSEWTGQPFPAPAPKAER
jgi:predicted metalloprotease with PDZ domain